MGLTLTDIAKDLGISAGTVCNVLKRFTQTGEVHVKKHPKRDRKLDRYHEIYIINLILDSPSLQLKEIISKVLQITGTNVSSSTLCRLLARFGFTQKRFRELLCRGQWLSEPCSWQTPSYFHETNLYGLMKQDAISKICLGSMAMPSVVKEQQSHFC